MPFNYSNSLKQALMTFCQNSAEALASVTMMKSLKMQNKFMAVAGVNFIYYFS